MNMIRNRVLSSLRAFTAHTIVSLIVALAAAAVVFFLWYPHPYAEFLGGTRLFFLIIIVDVICGPLLTLILYNPQKPKRELAFDLSIIAAIQLGALGYGLYTMALARPVYLAFELDRFRVVSYVDLESDAFSKKPPLIPAPGWFGPELIAVKVAQPDDADYLKQVELSVNGIETVYRPDRWISYSTQKELAAQKARSIDLLKKKHPDKTEYIDDRLKELNLNAQKTVWLPMQSRRASSWIILIDQDTGSIAGYLPLDGF